MRRIGPRVLPALALTGMVLVAGGCAGEVRALEKRNRQALEYEFPDLEWVVRCYDRVPMDQPMMCNAGFVADDELAGDLPRLYERATAAAEFLQGGGLDGVGGIGVYRRVNGKLFGLRVVCPGASPRFERTSAPLATLGSNDGWFCFGNADASCMKSRWSRRRPQPSDARRWAPDSGSTGRGLSPRRTRATG